MLAHRTSTYFVNTCFVFIYNLTVCQVTPWELVSFLGFLLEPSPHALLHPRTTMSRTTQKYKLNLLIMCDSKNLLIAATLPRTTWGDAWGERVVGAVQQVRHRDGDYQDWQVRNTLSCFVASQYFMIPVNDQRWKIKLQSRGDAVEKERNHLQIWSFPVWLQLVWIIYAAWDYDDATSLDQATPFIALSRQDPLSIDGKSLSEDGVDREEVGRSNVSEENFFR